MADRCLVTPTQPVHDAADLLDVAARLLEDAEDRLAKAVIRAIDEDALWAYYDEGGLEYERRHAKHSPSSVAAGPKGFPAATLRHVAQRDHWRCQYCGVRLVDPAFVKRLHNRWPRGFPLRKTAAKDNHAATLLQYSPDHVVPRRLGGSNNPANLVASCWTCQFSKGSCTVEELGLEDPRGHPIAADGWNGLSDRLRS